jgi:hypothetical protein
LNKIVNIILLLLQAGLAFVIIFCTYMIFAIFEYKGGVANFVGLALFQPLLGMLSSGLTVVACLLIGLPIRLNKKLNSWWREHYYISIILILIGFSFCVASLTPSFIEEISYRMDGMDFTNTVPNRFLSIMGVFALSIGTTHLFPPLGLQRLIGSLLSRNK